MVLVSTPNSWQAYYYWLDDARAPGFARTVDIHRKPGYDPVELFFDPATKGIPLNANLVRGSHGAPAREPFQRGVIVSSERRSAGRQCPGRHRRVRPGAAAVRDVSKRRKAPRSRMCG